MKRSLGHFLSTFAVVIAATACAQATLVTYDLSAGFSASNNPNGPWVYGSAQTIGGQVTPITTPWNSSGDGGVTIPSWQLSTFQTPAVYKNTTDSTISVGDGLASFPAGTVWFYPGDDGLPENYGVVRFTVPANRNGKFTLRVDVAPVYPTFPQGDTDFHVVKNGAEVYGRFLAPDATATYEDSFILHAGDTVDFVIGRGADGSAFGSGLRIAATLKTHGNPDDDTGSGPSPQSFVLSSGFSASSNPNGPWAYGWAPTLGGSFTTITVPWTSSDDNGGLIPSWQLTSFQTPAVYKNTSGGTITVGAGIASFPAETVWFYPGDEGQPENYGVIRFTTPQSINGRSRIQVTVSPVYPTFPQGDTDFHVLINGTEVFGRFLDPTAIASFGENVRLNPGDTVDFVIGRGADGSSFGSGLRISASISKPGSN